MRKRTITTKLLSVPSPDEGSDADPDSLWPLGDEVATALLGLLEVELRRRGLRWRGVARAPPAGGRTPPPRPRPGPRPRPPPGGGLASATTDRPETVRGGVHT